MEIIQLPTIIQHMYYFIVLNPSNPTRKVESRNRNLWNSDFWMSILPSNIFWFLKYCFAQFTMSREYLIFAFQHYSNEWGRPLHSSHSPEEEAGWQVTWGAPKAAEEAQAEGAFPSENVSQDPPQNGLWSEFQIEEEMSFLASLSTSISPSSVLFTP